MGSRSSGFKAYTALAFLYFFWGTTYLGIRVALESFPPLSLVSIRFLISGGILLIAAKLFGWELPRGRELIFTALNGILMLGVANGALVYAEQWIPSGLAALFVSTSPFWMVGLQASLPGGEKLHGPTLGGIAIGFIGVAVLVAPAIVGAPGSEGYLAGFLLLQVSCCCWCLGALLQKRLATRAHPVVGGAIQQFAVGLLYTPFALLMPQPPIRLTDRGLTALVWLVIFGSIVGYSSFVYSMEHLPAAVVSTHTYVNPIVAVFLGWLILHEPVGWREIAAMVTVFSGVALVKYFSSRQTGSKARAAEAA